MCHLSHSRLLCPAEYRLAECGERKLDFDHRCSAMDGDAHLVVADDPADQTVETTLTGSKSGRVIKNFKNKFIISWFLMFR